MSAKHTPGPWAVFENPAQGYGTTAFEQYAEGNNGLQCDIEIHAGNSLIAIVPAAGKSGYSKVIAHRNARLIAAAPAMELALEMISLGVARIERSPSGTLIEFCFNGIRYLYNGDWSAMLNVIGWDKARSAIAKAAGAAA